MAAADDFDVEDLLEEAFNKTTTPVDSEEDSSAHDSPQEDTDRTEDRKQSSHHRSRRSRSRSRSKSPKRHHKRRSSSRDRRRSPPRPRFRRKSRSPQREIRRSHDRRRSGHEHGPRRSPTPDRSAFHPPTPPMYKRVGGHSPEPEIPSEDRDRRTVMCMQLAARVGPSQLEEFFQKVGQVREVKMIADKNSRRSKGIAYVEFHDESSVFEAMKLTGQRVFGVPIIVQPTMAEKNRLAAQAQNLMKQEGPRKLYVGSLHYNITDQMLKRIFEPFGHVEKMTIQRDENGQSKGFGFVEFKDADSAERAMTNLNGFEIAGRPIKVNHVTEHPAGGPAMETLDGEEFTGGVGMSLQSKANLMAKLAEGHKTGMSAGILGGVPAVSTCFMLSNMFDPVAETELGWEADIRDDVLEECNAFGPVLHIYVDSYSQGNVYVKCVTPQIAASAFNALNGRFFSGKKIVAQFIPEETYHVKFPDSLSAAAPLKPVSDNS